MHARLAVARRELPRAVRIAIAAALSWWVARLLGADRPVFAVAPSRPETLLPARCSRTPRSMPARPRGQSRTSRARCGALRLSLLRRRSRPELELVAQRQGLALRLAIQVRRLARDLASFAHRDDVEDQWREAARRLPPIIGLVAAASSRALAGEGCSREVASAREIMADYRREDARPASAILRRPLVLLLDELAGPPA